MSNVSNVDGMANDTMAIFYHCSSIDENPQHQLCPKGEFTWCKYNKWMHTKTQNPHTNELAPKYKPTQMLQNISNQHVSVAQLKIRQKLS